MMPFRARIWQPFPSSTCVPSTSFLHSSFPLSVPFPLSTLDMRRDVQEIFRVTPHSKQVMMFSATLAKEIRVTCKKFMANVCGFLHFFDLSFLILA